MCCCNKSIVPYIIACSIIIITIEVYTNYRKYTIHILKSNIREALILAVIQAIFKRFFMKPLIKCHVNVTIVSRQFSKNNKNSSIFSDIHRIMKQFETLLNKGYQQNLQTQHIYVVSKELSLLNRLTKYKNSHLCILSH